MRCGAVQGFSNGQARTDTSVLSLATEPSGPLQERDHHGQNVRFSGHACFQSNLVSKQRYESVFECGRRNDKPFKSTADFAQYQEWTKTALSL